MKTQIDVRQELIGFVEGDLVGPAGGPEEVLEDQPRIRYLAGVLFPQESKRNESVAAGGVEQEESDGAADDSEELIAPHDEPVVGSKPKDPAGVDSEYDDTVTLSNSYRPSAMGLSFAVIGTEPELLIQVSAATYRPGRTTSDGERVRSFWKRVPLDLQSVLVKLPKRTDKVDLELVPGMRLRVVSRYRSDHRWLVTASVYNSTIEHHRDAVAFYQVGFYVQTNDDHARIPEYRSLEEVVTNDEELGLALLYRHRRVFAVGHGCSADWNAPRDGHTSRVVTTVLPSVKVPPVLPLSDDKLHFNMEFLGGSTPNPRADIPAALSRLCDDYEAWIDQRLDEVGRLDKRFIDVATRHVALCRLALRRMRGGIATLRKNPMAFDAFTMVNRVMLMQQHHSRLRRALDDPWKPLPASYHADWDTGRGYWRAFQLAFFLLTIPGLIGEEDAIEIDDHVTMSRDLVDLIWFPTGGGKTEAYLAVTAFVIFISRMLDPSRRGCRALMRYTLRLLTSQQFQRAASLICACELVRQRNSRLLGEEAISVGLWVGQSLTPNDEKDALNRLATLSRKRGDAKNPFQLLSCPWCGTELNNPDRLGYVEFRGRQVFLCPSRSSSSENPCPFSRAGNFLPVCVVDESIYQLPPALVIGTVDKFAMLAWRESAGAILSVGGGPDLIIQDELHLISGPLGSMVGLYESAIDYLCSRNGRSPKIIASTATIRRAEEQCRALYDREMLQFPPPGLDASDSYFAVEDPDAPGRIYLGFLPTASSSPLTAQIRSVVSLQQGVVLVTGPDVQDAVVDPYWTLVQYFGSLKELGRAATFITADIPEFLPTMHRRYHVERANRRWMAASDELTSRKSDDEIPKIIKRLEVPYRAGAKYDDQALDTILATNMISVGVDIDRLGLMMIVTQPKGTSEYIQASSRVGRSRSAPGLVFTLYNAGRPRDRSHYEHFRAYHEAFYQFVEPTSVTPFSPPALDRCLSAVLVIGARHAVGWRTPADFSPDDEEFADFVNFLRDRTARIDADHVRDLDEMVQDCLDDWNARRPGSWGDLGRSATDKRVLIRIAGTPATDDDPDTWEVPTSMRNVDVECSVQVVPRYASAGNIRL